MVQAESPDGLPGRVIMFSDRDLASHTKHKALFATGERGDTKRCWSKRDGQLVLPLGAERDVTSYSVPG